MHERVGKCRWTVAAVHFRDTLPAILVAATVWPQGSVDKKPLWSAVAQVS